MKNLLISLSILVFLASLAYSWETIDNRDLISKDSGKVKFYKIEKITDPKTLEKEIIGYGLVFTNNSSSVSHVYTAKFIVMDGKEESEETIDSFSIIGTKVGKKVNPAKKILTICDANKEFERIHILMSTEPRSNKSYGVSIVKDDAEPISDTKWDKMVNPKGK